MCSTEWIAPPLSVIPASIALFLASMNKCKAGKRFSELYFLAIRLSLLRVSWLARSSGLPSLAGRRRPFTINPSKSDTIRREANPDGALYGDVIVFTGALEIPRREAADMAASIGCEVAPGVTKKTTLLVVGDQDVARLAGQSKSSKHRKAESLILKGVPIRILRESDFRDLVEGAAVQ